MKKDNILRLASFLENEMMGEFSMDTWLEYDETLEDCETVGCIAGWACYLFMGNTDLQELQVEDRRRHIQGPSNPQHGKSAVNEKAAELLGLSSEQSNKLFIPWLDERLPAIHEKQAAQTLRTLADTGRVIWDTEDEEWWANIYNQDPAYAEYLRWMS